MKWDQVKEDAAHVGGKLKERWGRLTDDDLRLLEGSKSAFVAKLQERTGLRSLDAERQLDRCLIDIEVEK